MLLVNPNGIAITKSGVVNTGSFAASTLDIKNEDFLAGKYKFTGNGSSATVTNAGRINVSDGGFAALLGGRVANDGVITARLGKVGLGSGEMITLDMSGDGFVSVAVPSSQLGNLRDGTGKALVSNKGKIRADGGTVFLSAATASTLLRDAVNVPGSIRANSVGTQNGRIVIGGGLGGRVSVSGRLAASGRHSGGGNIAVTGAAVSVSGKVTASGKTGGSIGIASTGDLAVSGTIAATGSAGQGGRIDLAGADIKLVGAKIDASGATGGGLVRVGGTFQGGHGNPGDPLYQSFVGRFGALTDITSARTVSIDAGSSIDVSAKASGDAGTAVVWSDQYTGFSGTIVGNGGAAGGHGGYAEVSSKGVLEYLGTANLLAAVGNTGTLLLDPNDLIISGTATSSAGSAPNYTAGATTSYLKNTDLQTALGTASVVVTASGKITVSSSISWSAATTLTMTSGDELAINANITNANVGSALVLRSTGSDVYFQGGTTNVYSITATGSNPGFGSIISSGSHLISNGAGNVTLNAGADGMNLNGGITTGTLTMNSAGWVTQVAALNVTNLLLKGTGDFDLTTTGNRFSVLAANTTGRVNVYANSIDLAIGSVGGVNGVTANTLSLQIGINRTVTQSQAINVGNLTLRNSSGNNAATYTLTNANNRVGSFAARIGTSGVIKLYGTGGLTIASVFYDANNAIGGVASVGTLTISNTGSVIQSNSIFATNLELLGVGGSYVLTNTGNAFSTLAANTGSVNLVRNAGGLATVTLNGTVGITTTGDVILTSAGNVTVGATGAINAGGAVALTTTGASTDIAINGAISTPTNSVTLSSRRNVTQGAAGTISAARLLLLGAGVSYNLTNAGNSVGTLAANTGTVNFSNNAALIVGSVASTTGVTTTGAVTLKTTGATSDIAINAAIATPVVFTLSSARNITATGSVNVGSYIQQAGNWSQIAGVLPSFSATDFRITGGSFLRALGGTGAAATPYLIADVYGLQGMGTSTTLLTNSFKLANNIDATGTSGWNAGAGFAPIGISGAPNRFSGKFDGAGHTINGLFINRGNFIGLFGVTYNATIANVGLVGGSITGSVSVGALVGYQIGGSITHAFSTAAVSGFSDVGGLVGFQDSGSISQSYASGAVSGTSSAIGGLVGSQFGSITQSYATGSVTGGSEVGGLVGYNSYATISQSYAVGRVTGSSLVGGLVGSSDYTPYITTSYWDTQTTGQGTSSGGTARTTAQMQDLSAFATNYAGFDFQNVWAPPSTGYYPQLYAMTAVVWDQAANKTRSYGDPNPALTATIYGGPVSYVFGPASDTLNVSTILSTTANAASGVGSYAITNTTGATATSTGGVVYRVVRTDGTLSVTPRAITVTADGKTRIYGDANPALTYQVTSGNLVNGDSLSGALATAATVTNGVGSYAITQNTVTSSNNPNYAISYVGANLDIGARAITVTADGKNRSYGDANPALTYQVTTGNLVNGDSLTGTLATAATVADGVGKYAITQNTVTSSNNPNYAITYVGANLDIGARAITVTADGKTRSYGDANPALTSQVTSGNLVNGDSLAGTLATAATVTDGVGSYAITQNTVSSSNNPNYAITYVGANLDIGARAVTVTADGKSRSYGDANPALTYQVTSGNLVNGDSLSGALATAATVTDGVGSFAINQNTVTSSNNPNYAISYVGANLDIGARAITVTADGKSRIYGDANPALTYQVTSGNLVNGDSLAGALATAATVTSGVGSFAINQNTVTSSNNPNYAITYLGADLTVTQATLLASADAASRIYGVANPALSGSITGFKNNETAASFGGDVWTTPATLTSDVGSYGISGGLANASPNYVIVQAAANATAFTITPRTTGVASSQVNPPPPSLPTVAPTIPSSPVPGAATPVSFTTTTSRPGPAPSPVRVANAPSTDVEPAALPQGQDFATNNGLTYLPISQCDANEYSDFKAPASCGQAGEAAVFVMIARGVDKEHAADAFIDSFWNATTSAWTPPKTLVVDKVTFSDGDGKTLDPTGNAGVPIVQGSTDFAELLKSGPVMISDGGQPAHWLLATQVVDGKGIVANDPATGKQILLAYDLATRTLGGVTAVFDGNSKKFVAIAQAAANAPTLTQLQGFVASTFLVVNPK